MLRLPSFAESQGCKPVDECEVGTLRSLGEGGCASEGSALRSVWRGATAVRPWGSTGFPVTIAARADAPFRAFNDMLSGTIIHVAPKRLIVQTWRSDRARPRQRSGGRFRRSQPRLGEVLLDAVARSSERGNQTSIRDAGAISDLRELPKLKEGILEPDCQSHPWPAFVKSTLSCL